MHQANDIGAEQPVIAPTHATDPQMNLEVNLEGFSSATLARLVEEVRNEDLTGATKYDRVYNRHNR
jgi:hypothetical protein